MEHISILKKEVIELLNIKPNGLYLDMTLGRAGHATEILKKLEKGRLISFDLDETAIKESEAILKKINDNFELIHNNFLCLKEELNKRNIKGVDGILFDLGVSSPQFDDASRGFSYRYDGPLDMRMDNKQKKSAYEVINNYSLNDLTRIIREYGEDKDAYKIAKEIVKVREIKAINTTFELVDLIKKAKTRNELIKKGHPAKQVFQAIRIEVNDELNNLRNAINDAINALNIGGRLAIISFHSLEDRIVKEAFNKVSKVIGDRIDEYKIPTNDICYRLVNKQVILPSEEEIKDNPRAKSAKLRVLERIK